MKNKTPALEAEVLCKALDGNLHSNSNLPTCRAQRLAAFLHAQDRGCHKCGHRSYGRRA